ncbi:MAG: NAD(P)-binding protein [Gammaproteobacteria bacterium]|nr:NAD(P)-binding protein [Gammaproteobacteria bacterium]
MRPGPATKPVIVVGGGWAGIAAAVELARHNIPLILLESAKQLGGRARCVSIQGMHIDNGQHMLLSAYESTLSLLRTVGISEDIAFERRPLSLQWLRTGETPVTLNTPALPAPWHLAWGLLRAKGLSLRDRLAALRMSQALQNSDFSLPQDCSVSTLLKRHRQPEAVIRAIWEPLCLGALNTHIHEASAELFLRTLGDSFRYSTAAGTPTCCSPASIWAQSCRNQRWTTSKPTAAVCG